MTELTIEETIEAFRLLQNEQKQKEDQEMAAQVEVNAAALTAAIAAVKDPEPDNGPESAPAPMADDKNTTQGQGSLKGKTDPFKGLWGWVMNKEGKGNVDCVSRVVYPTVRVKGKVIKGKDKVLREGEPLTLSGYLLALPHQLLLVIFHFLMKIPWSATERRYILMPIKEKWIWQVECWGVVSVPKLVRIHLSNKERYFEPLRTFEDALENYRLTVWHLYYKYSEWELGKAMKKLRRYALSGREEGFVNVVGFYLEVWETYTRTLDKWWSMVETISPLIEEAQRYW